MHFLEDRLQNSGWMYDVFLYSDFAPENYKSAGGIRSVSDGWLKDYHSFAGMIFDCPNIFELQRDSSAGKESLMMKLFRQDISQRGNLEIIAVDLLGKVEVVPRDHTAVDDAYIVLFHKIASCK